MEKSLQRQSGAGAPTLQNNVPELPNHSIVSHDVFAQCSSSLSSSPSGLLLLRFAICLVVTEVSTSPVGIGCAQDRAIWLGPDLCLRDKNRLPPVQVYTCTCRKTSCCLHGTFADYRERRCTITGRRGRTVIKECDCERSYLFWMTVKSSRKIQHIPQNMSNDFCHTSSVLSSRFDFLHEKGHFRVLAVELRSSLSLCAQCSMDFRT